jgi:hypothetical protein
MSADIQQDYPFDIGFAESSSMTFAELDLSRSQQPSEMLTSAPQQAMYFSPSAENKMEMEGDLDLHYPTCSPSPHALPQPAAPTSVQSPEVMSPSPPAFGAPVSFPRVPGSSNPSGLTGESDEDLGSESGDGEAAYPSDDADGDDDGDFMPNLTKKSRGRRVPTAPVIIVQGGGQKNMRIYRCTVDGCYN